MSNGYYKMIGKEGCVSHWAPFKKCEVCGEEFTFGDEIRGVFTAKYCEKCRADVRAAQNRERVRRFKERKKMLNGVNAETASVNLDAYGVELRKV